MASTKPIEDALVQHQVRVQGLSADEVRKFGPTLKALDKAIRARLSGDELTDLSRKRLEAVLLSISETLSKAYSSYRKQLDADLIAFGVHEADFTASVMGSTLQVSFTTPTESLIRAAMRSRPLSVRGQDGGKVLKTFLDDWSDKEVKALTNVIRRGVVEGQSNSEIVRAVRGTKAKGYNDGVLATTDRNARSVVQTAVQHVSSTARQATFEANKDVVKGVRWVATLDAHTCQVCRSLDGQVYAIDAGPRPPIHVADRCTVIPELDAEFQKYMKGATRPSVVDGKASKVDASESYYEWLKRQPAVFQDEVLGSTRGKLFRDGGLSAKRFAELQLDRNFKPLTLDQMKAIEGAAFKKAGL